MLRNWNAEPTAAIGVISSRSSLLRAGIDSCCLPESSRYCSPFGFESTCSTGLPSVPSQAPAMNVLKRKQRELGADLHRLAKEVRRVKRRASESETLYLREPQKSTARVLVAMHEGVPTAAIEYIRNKRKGKGLDAASTARIEADRHLRHGDGK